MATLTEIVKNVFANIGKLANDNGVETLIEERVTAVSLKRKINQFYKDNVIQVLMSKHSADFYQTTEPKSFYTSSGTVSTVSSYTLTSTTAIFSPYDKGKRIYNTTNSEMAEILSVVSTTSVTLKTEVGTTWVGDSIYVLGDMYVLPTDAKEIVKVMVQYSANNGFVDATREFIQTPQDTNSINSYYSEANPVFVLTTLKESSVKKRAIQVLPTPKNNLASIYIIYTEIGTELGDNDEPYLSVAGISEVLELHGTSWAYGLLGNIEMRDRYRLDQKEALANVLINYRPTSIIKPSKIKLGSKYINILHNSM